MYMNSIKYNYDTSKRIEGVSKTSRENSLKREKYEQVYRQERNKRYTEKFSVEDKYLSYERIRVISPTEVYINYINNNKELIYAISINTNPAYDIDLKDLGKNIDLII